MNTGGPAFPQTRTLPCGSHEECEGLTLRDYFAAQAMQALLAADYQSPCDGCAIDAYQMADAMLKARG